MKNTTVVLNTIIRKLRAEWLGDETYYPLQDFEADLLLVDVEANMDAWYKRFCVRKGQSEALDIRNRYALRYNYLRERDLDTIEKGGVFAGRTPENSILTQEDLDEAIDAALRDEVMRLCVIRKN